MLNLKYTELKTAKNELARLKGIAEAKARGYKNWKDLKDRYERLNKQKTNKFEELSLQSRRNCKQVVNLKKSLDSNGKVVGVVDGNTK